MRQESPVFFHKPMNTEHSSPPIDWVPAVVLTGTFVAAVILVPLYGLLVGFSVASWAWFAIFLVASGLSITAGYHRLWAHRAYQAHWSVRLFFMLFGAMAIQNSILVWTAGHRPHHRFVDDEQSDPYSARRGLWYSHIGWMLRQHPAATPDFKYVKDLQRDPIVTFQHNHYVAIVLVMNIALPALVGWLSGDLWGTVLLAGLLRLVVNHHVTFFINSLAHYWGKQPYTDGNTSRDNPVLALLTYGEGYHNFHHLFAHDYRNGIRWWHWDPTKWLIRALSWVGLTSQLRITPKIDVERARLDMQFKRAEAQIAREAARGDRPAISQLRQRLEQEYQAFTATLAEWSSAREAWMTATRQRVANQIDQVDTDLKAYAREIAARLRAQRRRLERMPLELA
jgi:stearoyl-CoA desaturase (Delta-9 desaturase)